MIYCGDCKYRQLWNSYYGGTWAECEHPANYTTKNTPDGQIRVKIFAFDRGLGLNKNNDCPHFEKKQSFIHRITNLPTHNVGEI